VVRRISFPQKPPDGLWEKRVRGLNPRFRNGLRLLARERAPRLFGGCARRVPVPPGAALWGGRCRGRPVRGGRRWCAGASGGPLTGAVGAGADAGPWAGDAGSVRGGRPSHLREASGAGGAGVRRAGARGGVPVFGRPVRAAGAAAVPGCRRGAAPRRRVECGSPGGGPSTGRPRCFPRRRNLCLSSCPWPTALFPAVATRSNFGDAVVELDGKRRSARPGILCRSIFRAVGRTAWPPRIGPAGGGSRSRNRAGSRSLEGGGKSFRCRGASRGRGRGSGRAVTRNAVGGRAVTAPDGVLGRGHSRHRGIGDVGRASRRRERRRGRPPRRGGSTGAVSGCGWVSGRWPSPPRLR